MLWCQSAQNFELSNHKVKCVLTCTVWSQCMPIPDGWTSWHASRAKKVINLSVFALGRKNWLAKYRGDCYTVSHLISSDPKLISTLNRNFYCCISFSEKNDKHVFLVIVMSSANYTFIFYPVTLCVCEDFSKLLKLQTEMVYLATTLTTSSCRVRVKCRILMRNGSMLRVRVGGHLGVRVRVVTRASVGVMVFHNFMH